MNTDRSMSAGHGDGRPAAFPGHPGYPALPLYDLLGPGRAKEMPTGAAPRLLQPRQRRRRGSLQINGDMCYP
jgi:hypothetical protein